jgi:hypothetical protein
MTTKGPFMVAARPDAAIPSDVLCLQALAAHAEGHSAAAQALLGEVVKRAGAQVFVPARGRRHQASLLASLWFLQTCGEIRRGHEGFWRASTAPLATRLAQSIIQDNFPHARMTDGGLLECDGPNPPAALLRDTLWYSALASLAAGLNGVDAAAADHFERLGTRQRRTYMKAYWCDRHGCICATATTEGHPAATDPNALLAATLPYSALPRTKQRQMARDWAMNARGELGLKVTLDHGRFGESPLGLIRLAEAYVLTADNGQAALAAEALGWLAPLHAAAQRGPLPEAFVDHQPAPATADEPWAAVELRRVEVALRKLVM